ncbi:MAG: SHOCT domain-containing protein [Bacteroidetes bacterium]|nr:SHOCT domain-containing protein [Bacteroidota bacterium]
MIWILLVIVLIVIIVLASRSSKNKKLDEQIKRLDIEKKKQEINNPTSPDPAKVSIADEIEKLRKLKDNGTITEREFEEQKRKILS